MAKSQFWRLLLYVLLLLALGGILGHFAGDVICAMQGIEVNVACNMTSSDSSVVNSIASDSTLHGAFVLPASIAWAGWQILVFLALVLNFRPALLSLSPSPPPPRRIF